MIEYDENLANSTNSDRDVPGAKPGDTLARDKQKPTLSFPDPQNLTGAHSNHEPGQTHEQEYGAGGSKLADSSAFSLIFSLDYHSRSLLDKTKAGGNRPKIDEAVGKLKEHFPDANIYDLRQRPGLSLFLAVTSFRVRSPIDRMVRIDLPEKKLSTDQLDALREVKTILSKGAEVGLDLTHNHSFIKDLDEATDNDLAMSFVNRVQEGKSLAENQKYWLDHHGPKVIDLEIDQLSNAISSYAQLINTDVNVLREEHGNKADVFTDRSGASQSMGLSFETLSGGFTRLLKEYVLSPSFIQANNELKKDEENFTLVPAASISEVTRLN